MNESNCNSFKASISWKKALYSSILFGSLFVGVQYVGLVNAHADDNANIYFHDDVSNQQVDSNIPCEIGQTVNLQNKILRLADEGYDTSGVPASYTPTSDSNVIHIRAFNSSIPSTETKQYKLQIRLLDQNGNYVSTRNYQSDDKNSWNYDDIFNDIENAGYKIVRLDNDNRLFSDVSDQSANGNSNTFYSKVYVIEPEHIINVNFIDQDGHNVQSLQHAVTDYGNTDITSDLNNYVPSGLSVVSNKDSNTNVYVTQGYPSSDTDFNYEPLQTSDTNGTFVKTSTPSVLENSAYGDNSNPLGYVYHTSVTVKSNNGNVIDKYIVSSNYDNIVDTSYFTGKYGNNIQDENDHASNPNYIDLTKGPYTFMTNSSSSASMPNNSSTATPNFEDLPTMNDSFDKSQKATLAFTTDYGFSFEGNKVWYDKIDRSKDEDVINDYGTGGYNVEAQGYIGQTESLRNVKVRLNDLGYDTSNVPDNITFDKGYQEIKVVPFLKEFPSKTTSLIKLINQFDNYVGTFTEPLESDPDKRIGKVYEDIKEKGYGHGHNQPDDLDLANGQNNIYTVEVATPMHQLTINYVDQHNNVVFSTKQFVDYYGHTDFYDDQELLHNKGIAINPGQSYVSNKQDTATVYVTSSDTFQNIDSIDSNREDELSEGAFEENSKDYGYVEPMVITTRGPQFGSNPNGDAFYAPMKILDKNGKTLYYGVVSSSVSNIVTTENLSHDVAVGYKGFNMSHITDMPKTLDLTKGPFVFHSTEVSDSSYFDYADGSTANPQQAPKKDNSQSKKKIENKSKRSTKLHSKPTKAQLKTITKSFKQAKHAVKSDTAKLKTLKKKMKKHATKKQKAAYKKLQTKLAAERKALASVKTKEGKLAKYFKSVATISRDNKQIKSLTAQMKKLKKKHSKASKKLYKKDLKALKKANKSLKAATKFVKNYK